MRVVDSGVEGTNNICFLCTKQGAFNPPKSTKEHQREFYIN